MLSNGSVPVGAKGMKADFATNPEIKTKIETLIDCNCHTYCAQLGTP